MTTKALLAQKRQDRVQAGLVLGKRLTAGEELHAEETKRLHVTHLTGEFSAEKTAVDSCLTR